MNKFKFIGLLSALILSSSIANAQIWKRLQKKVEQKVEQKLEQKAEDQVDRSMDSLMNSKKNNETKTNTPQSMDKMGALLEGMTGKPAVIEDKYLFRFNVVMKLTDFESNEVQYVKQSYSKDAFVTGENNGDQAVLTDIKNNSSIILDFLKGTAQTMNMGWMQGMMEMGNTSETSDGTDNVQVKHTKTGRTKMILGYTTHEYKIEFEGGSLIAWFAPEVDFDYKESLGGLMKMMGQSSATLTSGEGYVMEMTTYDKKGGVTNQMEVVELNEKPRLITMSSFKVSSVAGQ
ncbi:hypothetical protein [Nonlabens spongiae]|nr:hypothetical protein [Nonlabens spongiae]